MIFVRCLTRMLCSVGFVLATLPRAMAADQAWGTLMGRFVAKAEAASEAGPNGVPGIAVYLEPVTLEFQISTISKVGMWVSWPATQAHGSPPGNTTKSHCKNRMANGPELKIIVRGFRLKE